MNKQAKWIMAFGVMLFSVATLAQQEEPPKDSDANDISESLIANGEPKTGEIRYVTDLIYTPIRTGPGGDYRIVNKGLPSGTQITYFGTTEDGVWAEVETRGGTRGYLRSQYLQVEAPRANQVNALENELESAQARVAELEAQLDASLDELSSSNEDRGTTAKDLEATQQELAEIKRISANAIQLDRLTNELTSKLEDANARNDLLKLENARLEDRVASRQRLEGILAILAGVFIALLIPRLTVKRRRNDGWR
ncbi:MAG: TIGR04211 family SH3 domain-containing protein [Halieaceae bacterium]